MFPKLVLVPVQAFLKDVNVNAIYSRRVVLFRCTVNVRYIDATVSFQQMKCHIRSEGSLYEF
jgi:hypothetical protein